MWLFSNPPQSSTHAPQLTPPLHPSPSSIPTTPLHPILTHIHTQTFELLPRCAPALGLMGQFVVERKALMLRPFQQHVPLYDWGENWPAGFQEENVNHGLAGLMAPCLSLMLISINWAPPPSLPFSFFLCGGGVRGLSGGVWEDLRSCGLPLV